MGAYELKAPCSLGFIGVRVVVSEPAYGSGIFNAIPISTQTEEEVRMSAFSAGHTSRVPIEGHF